MDPPKWGDIINLAGVILAMITLRKMGTSPQGRHRRRKRYRRGKRKP